MDIWSLFRTKDLKGSPGSVSPAPLGAGDDLFDDAFQRKLETLALASRRIVSGRQRADRATKRKGQGIAFADYREYCPGDDVRFVDWAVYQRLGRMLVRLFEEQEDMSVYFLLDCSRSMAFGDAAKFAQARRLCAALSYVSLSNLDRVSVVGLRAGEAGNLLLPATRGKMQIFKMFRFLNQLKAEGGTDLGESLKSFAAQHRRKGLAVLFSDLYDPHGYRRGLDLLRYNKFEPYLVHLCDAREYAPKNVGDVLLSDCETGAQLELTLTPALAERVSKAFADYCSDVRQYCRSNQVGYLAADVQTPFDEVVLSAMRRGGFLT